MRLLQCALLALLWPAGTTYAQFTNIRPLNIGDTLPPDLVLENVVNYPASKIRLSDLKGKFIILDFWATWCPACIRETPKLDTLQSQFNSQLQIIMVGNEPAQKIKTFLVSHKGIPSSSLPFAASDTLLKQYFPHRYLPHQIWITPNRVIQAIVGTGNATQANISNWLAGNKPGLRLKKDADRYNRSAPLFYNDNGAPETLLKYRSQFAGRLPGRGGSSGYYTDKGLTRFYYINRPMLSLYQKALGFASGLVILEIKNPTSILLLPNSSEDHLDSCLYTYELTIPSNTSTEQKELMMINDFNNFFNLYGRMEKRTFTCYAIRPTKQTPTLFDKFQTENKLADYWYIINSPITTLIEGLNGGLSPGPQNSFYIDETGITENINMEIPLTAITNQKLLESILSAYGLSIVKTEKLMEVFVLSEKINQTK